jgi:hypothetical protein
MIGRLRGMITGAARQTAVAVANAGELVPLTDAELDIVAGGFASVAVSATNATALASFSLSDDPNMRLASITAFFMTNGTPSSGAVSAQVGPNM